MRVGRWKQCCIFRSVPAGTDGKSRTGMQTGMRHPHVPPRPKFRPVSVCFGRFGLFRPVYVIRPEYFFGFLFLFFSLFWVFFTSPPVHLQQLPPASSFQPHHSRLQLLPRRLRPIPHLPNCFSKFTSWWRLHPLITIITVPSQNSNTDNIHTKLKPKLEENTKIRNE